MDAAQATEGSEHRVWVHLAAFCEKVLQEIDNVRTLVRVVDRYSITYDPHDDVPEGGDTELEIPVGLIAALGFKTDGPPGEHRLDLAITGPDGEVGGTMAMDIMLASNDRTGVAGCQLEIHVHVGARQSGVYWMDVTLDSVLLTRMPMEIRIKRRAEEEQLDGDRRFVRGRLVSKQDEQILQPEDGS